MRDSSVPGDRLLFGVSWGVLGKVTMALPAVGMFFCVLWSMLFYFEEANDTHCKVWNVLPSISAATGSFPLQIFVWRICIALHCGPRFMVALCYYTFYRRSLPGAAAGGSWRLDLGLRSMSGLHVLEVLALVVLSMVSSREDYVIHRNAFVIFMVTSTLYMLMTCIAFKSLRTSNEMLAKSYRWKVRLFLFNISTLATACYLFMRHNWYCEPGVYSGFALFEQLGIASNMAFHWLSITIELRELQFRGTLVMPDSGGPARPGET